MNKNYDVVVIGSGNAGLMSALKIAEKGQKVLIIENNSIPGGFSTSTVKGRFEFENSLHAMGRIGTETEKGELRKIFDEYNINEKIEWIELKEAYKLIKKTNPKEEYIIPFGLDEFIQKMEEYEPNSKDKISECFELAKEIHSAFEYVKSTELIDYDYLKKTFPNFVNTASYSVDTVLKKIKLPKKIEEIITSYWIHFGTSSLNLNFAHYISEFYEFISNKAVIPKNRSYEISSILEKKIRDYGGEFWFNEEATKILTQNGQVTGLLTSNNVQINTNHIICNTSPVNIYTKLIDQNEIPKDLIKLSNSRHLGLRGINISLGLNCSVETLGIKNYMYYIYNSLDSNEELENIKNINTPALVVTSLNNINPEASEPDTSILNITAYLSGEVFDKTINELNYFTIKEKIASRIIEQVETTLEVNIKDNIEEIYISDPLTYTKQNNAIDGSIYGYNQTNNDSVLARILNKNEENKIKGLRICGAYSYYGHTFESTYINGYEVGCETLKDIEKGEQQ